MRVLSNDRSQLKKLGSMESLKNGKKDGMKTLMYLSWKKLFLEF
jgi:hypothetical protein